MGQEFELKFAATQADLEKLRLRYPNLSPISMETTYYDTRDGALSELRWTLRRRMENGKSVCTLKTPAGSARNEWETECASIEAAVPLLVARGAPKELEIIVRQDLAERCGARFTRLAGLLEPEGCTVELALDSGVLTGGGKTLPFAEVEVELKDGSREAAAAFARTLAEQFGLREEPRSKVARARALCDPK